MSKPPQKPLQKNIEDAHGVVHLDDMYEHWFLDYASYVILERAVPRIEDGLKPVQRRILHALKEMDDGRFNKVANIIGQTMQYHPHGDAAIGDAMIHLGQKGLLMDVQGNWGDVRTGDSAAAPRYIEARPSLFALDVVYNAKTTNRQLSYDGRKKEPVVLPIKFPLLLAQGVEGIAVGLSTKILPHNFCELLHASTDILKKKKIILYPDFPTGGYADFTEYNQGVRGGRIKVRAKIDIQDKKTLLIREIPYGTTTHSLIESIVRANDKGKIKIKQVIDNTAKEVEIQVYLQAGQTPEIAVDALYAFTDCEVSISPNACVIVDSKPHFMSVDALLKHSVTQTVELLKKELEIRQHALLEKIFFASLEKIFIEKHVYRHIEPCETFDEVMNAIDKGLAPYVKTFYRQVEHDDIIRLTEIKIKRISKYDSFKADKELKVWQEKLQQTRYHLQHLTAYAIAYYQELLEKYGKGRERKTIIKNFCSVTANEVIANNQKLYVNRSDGFLGWGLKKDEFLCECSDMDDVIAIRQQGRAIVSRIAEKVFMGKNILHAGVWKKGDERMVYNMIYVDGKTGKSFAKRFAMPAVVRDREYDLTQGAPNSKIIYLSANPNGEAESVLVKLLSTSTARKKVFEFNFSHLQIKGRGAKGNIVARYPVRKITLRQTGTSTLGELSLYFDSISGRLNKEKRGRHVGRFSGGDTVLSITRNGAYKLSCFDLNTRFQSEEKTLLVEKFDPNNEITAVYLDGKSKRHFVKRFCIETQTLDRDFQFIIPSVGSVLEYVTTARHAEIEITFIEKRKKQTQRIVLSKLVDVAGWKAIGKQLSPHRITAVTPVGGVDTLHQRTKKPSGETKKTSSSQQKNNSSFGVGDSIELAF